MHTCTEEEVGRQVKEADAGATRIEGGGGGVGATEDFGGGGVGGGGLPALAFMIVFVDSRVEF